MLCRRSSQWLLVALAALLLTQLLAPLHLHDLPGTADKHASEHQCPTCNHGEDLKHCSLTAAVGINADNDGGLTARPSLKPIFSVTRHDRIRAPPA